MADAEIRGRLLTHFHALRHNNGGWVPISDIILAPEPVQLRVIGGVCQQLADIGLIQWKPLRDSSGLVAGMAKITGQGVAAIEAGRFANMDIRFPSKDGATPNFPELRQVLEALPTPTKKILQGNSSLDNVLAQMAPSATLPKLSQKPVAPEPAPPPSAEKKPEILTLKPSLWGMSVDLKELWRHYWPRIKHRLGRS